jgi:hypothetical protein
MMVRRWGLCLLAAGVVTEAIYLGASLRLPWWRYGWNLRTWPELLGEGWSAFAACLLGVGLLLAAYLIGWRELRRLAVERPLLGRWFVWFFATGFAVTLLWLMPITSDVFNYLRHSYLYTDLGLNPLLEVFSPSNGPAMGAGAAEDAVLLAYPTAYASNPSIYGPAWTLVAAPGTVGRNDVAIGLLYLKGLSAASFLVSAWLVERVLRKVRPASALEGLYLFSWNPLVLLMAVGDAHNDIIMMAAALLAFWFLLRESWGLAFGTLAFSAWVKYVSVLFAPLFVLYAVARLRNRPGRRAWPAWTQAGLAALAVTCLVYWPLGSVEWGLGVLERLLRPANWSPTIDARVALGLPRILAGGGPGGTGLQISVPSLLVATGLTLFGVIYLCLTRRLFAELGATARVQCGSSLDARKLSSAQRFLDTGFLVSLLVFLFGAARSQPWHLIWPASLAGLSTQRWAWPMVILLSALMLVTQIWVEWGTPGLTLLF